MNQKDLNEIYLEIRDNIRMGEMTVAVYESNEPDSPKMCSSIAIFK